MIYQITETYASLVKQYNEAESFDEAQAILHQIQQISSVFDEKVDTITRAWKNEEIEFDGRKIEIDRLKAAQYFSEQRLTGLKQTLVSIVDSAGLPEPKVNTSIGKLGIQNNSRPAMTYQGEAEKLPTKYRRIIPLTYEPDSEALLEDFKKFEDVLKKERPIFLKNLKVQMQDEPFAELYKKADGQFATLEEFVSDWCANAEETWRNDLWSTWCESTGFPASVLFIRGRHPRLR